MCVFFFPKTLNYLSITHYVSESASKVKLELHNVQWGDKTVFSINLF